MVIEVTISGSEGNLILGVAGQHIKYKINGQRMDSIPLEQERIILYSKLPDGGRNWGGGAELTAEEISFIPKMNYYPIICKNFSSQEIPGKIINIEEKLP